MPKVKNKPAPQVEEEAAVTEVEEEVQEEQESGAQEEAAAESEEQEQPVQEIVSEENTEIVYPNFEVRVWAAHQVDLEDLVKLRLVESEEFQNADPDTQEIMVVGAKTYAGSVYRGPMSYEEAKQLLGWITEPEAIEQILAQDENYQKANEEQKKALRKGYGFGDDFVLKNREGQKVRFLYSSRNRELKEPWIKKIKQQILRKQWAGPSSMEGETINGESVIITRTGQVASAQHRLAAFILACEDWMLTGHWSRAFWPEMPVLETVVVMGVSDDPKVIETLDRTLQRTMADMYFVSSCFDGWKDKDGLDLGRKDRSLLSKMLAQCVEFCWNRLGWAGSEELSAIDATESLYTQASSRDFTERHPRLLKALKHLWEENAERGINVGENVSPGRGAGMMFLMATSKSDIVKYRNGRKSDGYVSENMLDFSYWDQAASFWAQLAKTFALDKAKRSGQFGAVAEALESLTDADSIRAPKQEQKDEVLARAWALYKDGKAISAEDLALSDDDFYIDVNSKKHLKEPSDFGGADVGPKRFKIREGAGEQVDPEQQEIEDMKVATRAYKGELSEDEKKKMTAAQKLLVRRLAAEDLKKKNEAKKAAAANGSAKPDAPHSRPGEAQAAQTERARKADEELAKQGNPKAKAALKGGIGR